MSCSTSPDLIYLSPDQLPKPSVNTIRFRSSIPLKTDTISSKQLEDGKLSDECKPIIPRSPFTPQCPAQIQIKVEHFESTHNAREVKNKQQAALKASNDGNTPSNVQQILQQGGSPSHVSQQLFHLYQSLHTVYGTQPQQQSPQSQPQQQNNKDKEVESTSSDCSKEEEDNNDNGWYSWQPKSPALCGDMQNPPHNGYAAITQVLDGR